MPRSDLYSHSSAASSVGGGDASSRTALISLSMLRKESDLERIEEDWKRLTGDQPAGFQSFGWNRAWARHFRACYEELAVFVLYRNSRAVSILPCFRNGRRLRLIGDELCDFQDIIAFTPEDAEQLLEQVFLRADEERFHFDFRKLSARGNLWPLVGGTAERCGFPYAGKTYGRCPWFVLTDSGEEFLLSVKARLRKRIRRALRRLEDLAPEHENRFLESGAINEETIRDIAKLHRKNQHRKEGESIFESRAYCSFLLEAGRREDVGLRILETRSREGDLIAFDLGLETADSFRAYLGAFDEPYGSGSPGMCLLHWQMDVFPLRGVTTYDFLCGEEPYKFDYASETYEIFSVRLYPRGWGNHCIVAGMKLTRRAKILIKSILGRVGLR